MSAASSFTAARSIGRFFAAFAIFTSAAVVTMDSAAACQWTAPGNFWGTQSNGYGVNFLLAQTGQQLRGSATHARHYQRQHVLGRGSADGAIRGSSFVVTVYWGPSSVGVYEGTINAQGRITGTTYDQRNPKSRAQWNSDILLACR
jgi:hypothetical protein